MIEFREWADENCFQSKDAYVGAEQAWDYKQDKIDKALAILKTSSSCDFEESIEWAIQELSK